MDNRFWHGGRYHTDRQPGATVDEVTAAWVASASGLHRPALTPLPGALAWRIDEHPS